MTELDRAAICRRIAEAREEAGLTQEELADGVEPPVHWRTVQIWERGEKTKTGEHRWSVPFKRLGQIADLTGRTKEWLLHGEDAQAKENAGAIEALDSRLGALEVRVGELAPAEMVQEGFAALEAAIAQIVERLSPPDAQQN